MSRPGNPANDNAARVRALALPVIDLGAGSRIWGARGDAAAAIAKGGGVDHGCRLNLTRAASSSGKFCNHTGAAIAEGRAAAARAAYLVNWATRRGRRVDVLA